MFLVYHKHTYQTHLLPAGDTNNCTNIYTVKSLRCEERDQHQGDTPGIRAGWLGLHRGNCGRRGVPGGEHTSTPEEEFKELDDGVRGRKTVTGRGRRAVPPVGSGKGRTAPGHMATRPEARLQSPVSRGGQRISKKSPQRNRMQGVVSLPTPSSGLAQLKLLSVEKPRSCRTRPHHSPCLGMPIPTAQRTLPTLSAGIEDAPHSTNPAFLFTQQTTAECCYYVPPWRIKK